MDSTRSALTPLSERPLLPITIRAFQSETAALEAEPEPLQAKITVHLLAGIVVLSLVLAFVMHLDRVVTSSAGRIVATKRTVVVQPLDPSIIKTIDVKQGEVVHAGQLIATLDPTLAAADVEQLKLQVASLDASIARAEAEQARKPLIMPKDTLPGFASYAALQEQLYRTRQAQFDAQIASYTQKIEQAQATIAQLQIDEQRYADRLSVGRQIHDMRSTLQVNGLDSKLNLLVATDQEMEIRRQFDFDKGGLAAAEHQLAGAVADRDSFTQQWAAQTSQELVTSRNSRDAALQQLTKATKHADLVQLQAPEDAVVLKIAKLSVGSVLQPGQDFIDLVPLRSPMEAEADIASAEVGFIRPGDPAVIKLDPFNYVEHGTASGVVNWISSDAFTTDDNGQPTSPYYKVRVTLTDVDLHNVPAGFRLIPGMTLTADVHIGTRSVAMYLLGGFLQGANEAMREP